jgi:prophage tail gpP-like protein
MIAPTPPLILATDVAGAFAAWSEVDLDCDLFVPADAMRLSGPFTQDGIPAAWPLVKQSNQMIGSLLALPVFSGQRTSAVNEVAGNRDELTFMAASSSKVLVDCNLPIRMSKPAGTFASFAAEIAAQLGVKVIPGVGTTLPRIESVNASATEPAWSILDRLAKENGCWIWCDTLGNVRIESLAPYYAMPPVDTLNYMPGDPLNNIKRFRLRDDAGERYSHIFVKGQGPQRALQGNVTGILSVPVEGVWIDPELALRGVYRPLWLEDPMAKNPLQAFNRAVREAMIRKVAGQKIEMEVYGWLTSTGIPWQVTQMVNVSLPTKGIIGPFFVASRRLLQDLQQGTRAVLTLIEPGVL